MKQCYTDCKHPASLIDNGIEKAKSAKSIPQLELRTTKPKALENGFTHNPSNPSLGPLVDTTLNVMKTSKRLGKLLNKTKIINSKRQPLNLKYILTCAKFSSHSSQGGSLQA